MGSLEPPLYFDIIYCQKRIVVPAASSSAILLNILLNTGTYIEPPLQAEGRLLFGTVSLYAKVVFLWSNQCWTWLRLGMMEFFSRWQRGNWLKLWNSFTHKSAYWNIQHICVCAAASHQSPRSKQVTLLTMGNLVQFHKLGTGPHVSSYPVQKCLLKRSASVAFPVAFSCFLCRSSCPAPGPEWAIPRWDGSTEEVSWVHQLW